MDAVVRHLRDGAVKDDGCCPMVALCDHLGCAGGPDIMQQVLTQHGAGVTTGLCQAQHIRMLQLDGSLQVQPICSCVSVVDAWTDPAGWLRDAGIQGTGHHHLATLNGPQGLPTLLDTLTGPLSTLGQASNAHSVCVVVDNLSPLLLHQQAPQVLWWLEQLRTHPSISCILLSVQQAVVGPGFSAAVQRMATCVITLEAVSSLQQDVLRKITPHTPHGACVCAFKSRKAGRLRVEQCYYSLTPSGPAFFHAPAELASLMTPEALVALSVKDKQVAAAAGVTTGISQGSGGVTSTQAGAAVSKQASQPQGAGDTAAPAPVDVAGSMRLTLTEEERLAKQAVVLPYEHKGAGAAYQTGDWKDYLPVAAGGRAALPNHVSQTALAGPGGQLGQILYVRDSDDEGGGLHDSDEDPDDDLDI